ncbi:MAG: hypothetical protein J0G30_05585 [Actinomycetales bacterium]|nr:hypothetical protein [Actinomycetales bacterium]
MHVSVPRGRRASRLQGTVGHHLLFRSTDLMDASGVRTTTPERTWCDLATIVGLEDLVAAGDHLLASGTPRGLLSEVVEGYPGRRGSRLRREALGLLDAGAESPPESIIRVRVILAGLPRPVSNFVVRDRAGRFVARVDLAYPRFRMAIEYEGDHHRSDPQQWARDLARVPHLEDLEMAHDAVRSRRSGRLAEARGGDPPPSARARLVG